MVEVRGEGWVSGAAASAGAGTRGWFAGPYVDAGILSTPAVQVKWGEHAAGDRRDRWSPDDGTTSMCILFSGEFDLVFEDGRVELRQPGDFVAWVGCRHSWASVTGGRTVTIRWVDPPSDLAAVTR
jgi:hypothetical protein